MSRLLPMDLRTALPLQLVGNLTNPFTPIRVTAEAFLSLKSVVGQEFPRACQIKNTLDQVGDQQQKQVANLAKTHGHGVIGSGKRVDGASGSSSGVMEYKVESSEGRYTLRLNEDELCALLLNAEFVLVKMYEEHGIRRNPFLIRWIELYQWLLDDYVGGDYGDDDNSRKDGDGQAKKSDSELKLVKVRAAFIEAILNEIEEISNYSPKEYAVDPTHYPVDLSKFDDALVLQNIYDSKEEIPWNQDRYGDGAALAQPMPAKPQQQNGIWNSEPQKLELQLPKKQSLTQKDIWQSSHTPTPPPGLSVRSGYFTQQPQGQQQSHHQTQQVQPQGLNPVHASYGGASYQSQEQRNESSLISRLIHTLGQAQVDELADATASRLIKHFTDYPHHLFATLDPSEATLSALVQVNPKLTRALIQIYLLNTSRESAERKELLHTLQRLPVNLPTLELLNHLVLLATAATQGAGAGAGGMSGNHAILTKQEIDVLLHSYLANAMLKTEAIGTAITPASSTPGPNGSINEAGYFSNGINSNSGMATPGSRVGAAQGYNGLTGLQARSMQVRMVQLLCLFVGSLMNSGIIRIEEYFYEVQELGVRYIFVKEARELWQRVKSGKA